MVNSVDSWDSVAPSILSATILFYEYITVQLWVMDGFDMSTANHTFKVFTHDHVEVSTFSWSSGNLVLGESGLNGYTYYNVYVAIPIGLHYVVIQENTSYFVSDMINRLPEVSPNFVKLAYLPGANRVFLGTNEYPFEMHFVGDLLTNGSENEITKYEADNGEEILTSSKPVSGTVWRLNEVSRLRLDALNVIRGFSDVSINGQNVFIKTIAQEAISGSNLINIILTCQFNNDDKFITNE